MAGKKHLLHSIHHFITGAVLTFKGADKLSHHPVIGSIILLFGLLILGFFIYVQLRKTLDEYMEIMVRWFEAFVSLFTAYIFFTEGARYLPYVFLAAAIGFFISIYMFYKKQSRKGH